MHEDNEGLRRENEHFRRTRAEMTQVLAGTIAGMARVLEPLGGLAQRLGRGPAQGEPGGV
jgi:hypothetical protein